MVRSLSLTTSDKRATITAIRGADFHHRTGLEDTALLDAYLDADEDVSGRLSFAELESFQRRTMQHIKFADNAIALRPDQFLAAGAGDCDDYTFYTASLLRFWG